MDDGSRSPEWADEVDVLWFSSVQRRMRRIGEPTTTTQVEPDRGSGWYRGHVHRRGPARNRDSRGRFPKARCDTSTPMRTADEEERQPRHGRLEGWVDHSQAEWFVFDEGAEKGGPLGDQWFTESDLGGDAIRARPLDIPVGNLGHRDGSFGQPAVDDGVLDLDVLGTVYLRDEPEAGCTEPSDLRGIGQRSPPFGHTRFSMIAALGASGLSELSTAPISSPLGIVSSRLGW